MKLAPKFQLVTLLAGMAALNITSCAKKENIAPANSNSTNAPVPVYDVKNATAIYPTVGLAVDASGNVYVADYVNNIIKSITPKGAITIIAGSGHNGSADGIGVAASFNFPTGLVIDASNNLYVADSGNNLIRKITPAGVVTTVAGSGLVGSADGLGIAASFNFPQGITVDNAGNVYVADTGNDLIRKISASGAVSTLAGKVARGKTDGTGVQATFNIPQGIVVDGTGNLYVADAGNNVIRKITLSGIVTTFAGSGFVMSADGIGVGASFDFPDAIALDMTGNLYVTDASSHYVRKINTANRVTALPVVGLAFGGFLPPFGLTDNIYPNGIASNSKGTSIYVANSGDNSIELY
jgi:serine/threonine-protein kinase